MIERGIVISRLDPSFWLGITKPAQCLLILELEADLHLDLEVCNFVALHVPSDIAHLHPVDLTQISGGAFDAGPHRLGDAVRGGSGDLDDFVGVGFGQLCSFCLNHTVVDVWWS
jgi:hypothetical protein